jgi:hypothetical protein
VLRGFRQFDVPASIIVNYDRALHGSDIPPFDCWAVVNCLVNAAWSRGLGCVINTPGDHAVAGGAGGGADSRGRGDPDVCGDRMGGREVSGEWGGVAEDGGAGRRLCSLGLSSAVGLRLGSTN